MFQYLVILLVLLTGCGGANPVDSQEEMTSPLSYENLRGRWVAEDKTGFFYFEEADSSHFVTLFPIPLLYYNRFSGEYAIDSVYIGIHGTKYWGSQGQFQESNVQFYQTTLIDSTLKISRIQDEFVAGLLGLDLKIYDERMSYQKMTNNEIKESLTLIRSKAKDVPESIVIEESRLYYFRGPDII